MTAHHDAKNGLSFLVISPGVRGYYGVGGFAEIDEDSIVISAFAAAPVKQIIADLARPALIISTGFKVFNSNE